jgi:hypothetical protein
MIGIKLLRDDSGYGIAVRVCFDANRFWGIEMDKDWYLGENLLELCEGRQHLCCQPEDGREFAVLPAFELVGHGFCNLQEIAYKTAVKIGKTQEYLDVAMALRDRPLGNSTNAIRLHFDAIWGNYEPHCQETT